VRGERGGRIWCTWGELKCRVERGPGAAAACDTLYAKSQLSPFDGGSKLCGTVWVRRSREAKGLEKKRAA
jgi:hypothetical protein